MTNLRIEDFNIYQMISQFWFTQLETSSVWLSGYRMLRLDIADFPSGLKFLDLDNLRIVFSYGKANYLNTDAATPKFTNDGRHLLNPSNIQATTDDGAHLIIILPFDIDGTVGNEKETRDRISDTLGLLLAFNYQNVAFEHIFDYVINLDGKEQSVIGKAVTNPFSMPKPDLSNHQLFRIKDADTKIAKLDSKDQNKVRLSLRWFEAATYDEEGTDVFLKYWIALETLAMSNASDIKPIKEILSVIYEFSNTQTGDTFHIGRLFNLRGKIVHQGGKFSVSVYLIEFISAIYVDVLFQIVGLESEKRSLAVIQRGKFDPKRDLFQI